MGSHPRIGIGVPVYNGGTYFAEMMESLLAQTFGDFLVVVSDNCSTDDTEATARGFAARDARVRYHRNHTNIGASPNFNRAFELVGDCTYFKWAAHDDLYAPTFLERCVEALDSRSDAILAYSMVDVIDETDGHQLAAHPFYKFGRLESYVDGRGRPGWLMGPLHRAEGEDPAARFDEFLNEMIACFPIFAVIRTAALAGTGLHRPYFGSDRVLLAELVLKGRFHQVHERLYVNRYHASAGRLLPAAQQHSWITGSGEPRLPPQLQQYIDLLRAPFHAGLPVVDRVRCCAVAARHIARRQARRAIGTLITSRAHPVGDRQPSHS
jgi:glycosyltransferase involved in cell wall biosynthesis